jgi:hypothetical protein
MRVGQNPAKFVDQVAQPAEITVTVVSCIPFLSGFYEQSLEVLKACLHSIRANTGGDFDLMVFDNRSCQEVRAYLGEAHRQGVIQYLILSDRNIGKIGAWNAMFGAAQGKYIAFADSDIYFHPGWLPASLELFAAFPNVGMVTARPLRTPMEFSAATLEWAKQAGALEEGRFLDWETFWEHALSTGFELEKAEERFRNGQDHRLTYNGRQAYAGATHFQFLTRKDLLQKIIPLPSREPMRGERALDIAIDQLGCLRLCTPEALVDHMGNRLPEGLQPPPPAPRRATLARKLLRLPGLRHLLLRVYNGIFKLYFENVE